MLESLAKKHRGGKAQPKDHAKKIKARRKMAKASRKINYGL